MPSLQLAGNDDIAVTVVDVAVGPLSTLSMQMVMTMAADETAVGNKSDCC